MTNTTFTVHTNGQRLYEFTTQAQKFVAGANPASGLLTLFVRHTSCSLIIQENADPDVQLDLQEFFSRLAPQNMQWLRHTCEGPDDMPAHIKAALNQVSISIPIIDGQIALGTWQGVFLFEHRDHPHQRQIIGHISS